ncbi:hypothetical protein U879_09045 [Defluviimonas sp. 20V17]|nr:hypothetical protein U879_09045 [Defluviimonas sp. 20V17]
MLGALLACGVLLLAGLTHPFSSVNSGRIEKPRLTLGYLKQTDAAPIIVAKELGYFKAEGLDVALEPQSNIAMLETRLLSGALDGTQAPVGLPLATRIGYGARADLIVPLILGANGNAVTLSRQIWNDIRPAVATDPDGRIRLPVRANALSSTHPGVAGLIGHLNFGVVSELSSHNYQLRYWLAAGGIRPGYYTASDKAGTAGAQIDIWPVPAARMTATLEAGTIQGFAAGEPWNQSAAARDLGVPVINSAAIRPGGAEKAFVVSQAFADRYPNTTAALVRALIRASIWLDARDGKNRDVAARMLAAPEYVGISASIIALSLSGHPHGSDGTEGLLKEPSRFFRDRAGVPFYSEAIWYLTQMRRWGQIPTYKQDDWYEQTARAVFRPSLYLLAAHQLVAQGRANPGDFDWQGGGERREPGAAAIDGKVFDARHPNAYLDQFEIGLKGRETADDVIPLQD